MGDENDNVIQLDTLRRRKRWAEVGNALWEGLTYKRFNMLYLLFLIASFFVGAIVTNHFHQKALDQCIATCWHSGAKLIHYNISDDSCLCIEGI